jgi:hypothetical protein
VISSVILGMYSDNNLLCHQIKPIYIEGKTNKSKEQEEALEQR